MIAQHAVAPVDQASASPVRGEFVTVPEASTIARCHIETVRDALRSGELHGTQRVKGGTWKLRPECVTAWVDGGLCEHQSERRAPVSLASFRARGGAR